MKSLLRFMILFAAIQFLTPANAASFSCEKTQSAAEKIICVDPALSKRDELMGEAYEQAIEVSGKDVAVAVARQLLKKRDNCGEDAACIAATQFDALNLFGVLGARFDDAAGSARLTYGGKAPMKVTVMSASGLGTRNAVITVAHLRSDARNLCDAFGSQKPDCIESVLNTPLATAIAANCESGAFTTLYGHSLIYSEEDNLPVIKDTQSGEELGAAQASNYYAALEQFEALCPNRAAK